MGILGKQGHVQGGTEGPAQAVPPAPTCIPGPAGAAGLVRALLHSHEALILAAFSRSHPQVFRKQDTWRASETGMEKAAPTPAGEIKMGAMKPVQMLQAGLPSALSMLGHAVETLMRFAPLFELPERATGAETWR